MLYTLENNTLRVEIESLGAEIRSVKKDGIEYIWQRDPEYWKSSATVVFPVCGRMLDGKYTYEGKEYEIIIHGIVKLMEFTVTTPAPDTLVMTVSSNEETKKSYPFDFRFTVTYRLDGDTVRATVDMENTGDRVMPATFGAHPGFNVPFGTDGAFTDYLLDFGAETSPDRMMYSARCLYTGKKQAFPLVAGKTLPLTHDLFDDDAIFLANMGECVSLRSEKSAHSVTLHFPGFTYLGIWHKPMTEAPYVCIEPFYGTPGSDDKIDDIMEKNDMFHIQPQSRKTVAYSITFA